MASFPLPIGKHYINGQFVVPKTLRVIEKVDPTSEQVTGLYPDAEFADLYDAIQAANAARDAWAGLSRPQRGECFYRLSALLRERVTEAAQVIALDTGKTLNEARAEVIESLHMAEFTAGKGRDPLGEYLPSEFAFKEAVVLRKPKGLVAVISPWNFPLAIGGFWSSAPALLEGNVVVWKPSELTPFSAEFAAKLYHDAGFPKGVINVVFGGKDAGDRLASETSVNHIIFTGSVGVGRKIKQKCAEAVYPKTCQLELGSKSAVVVFADGNRELALQACLASAYKLSGQRCVSAGRLLIDRRILPDFIEQFVEASRSYKVGPWTDAAAQMGPLISAQQMHRVTQYNLHSTQDRTHPVVVHLQGTRLDRPGYFLTPHVYETEWHAPEDRTFLKEEVFGPHVAIIPFDGTVDEAVRIYNDTQYGLSMGVITKDVYKAKEMRDRCHFGLGYWNGGSIAAESHVPFGGVKASGYGWPSAAGTFDACVHKIAWTWNYGGLAFPQGMK